MAITREDYLLMEFGTKHLTKGDRVDILIQDSLYFMSSKINDFIHSDEFEKEDILTLGKILVDIANTHSKVRKIDEKRKKQDSLLQTTLPFFQQD
jgi:hypothetical protein